MPGEYSTVEFIELTSAVPFTLAQLKEFTLARGFIPSLHGATTPPHAFTSVWGRLTVPTCPLPCASGVSLTSPAARCLQSFSGSCMLPRCLCTVQCVVRRFDRCAAASQLSLLHHALCCLLPPPSPPLPSCRHRRCCCCRCAACGLAVRFAATALPLWLLLHRRRRHRHRGHVSALLPPPSPPLPPPPAAPAAIAAASVATVVTD
jgi:hypothetical protein